MEVDLEFPTTTAVTSSVVTVRLADRNSIDTTVDAGTAGRRHDMRNDH